MATRSRRDRDETAPRSRRDAAGILYSIYPNLFYAIFAYAGVGSITRKLPNGARGLRVYLEVFANSGGTTYDSNMLILNIN